MNTNRKELIGDFDNAINKAISIAVSNGVPIRVSKNITIIGNLIIKKNIEDLYDIMLPNRVILYKDIFLFDVAVIIAQKYKEGEISIIKRVLMLEEQFVKYQNDMIHYLNCLKGARKRHDIERMTILEDKFQIAEIMAKNLKNNILIFKRLK